MPQPTTANKIISAARELQFAIEQQPLTVSRTQSQDFCSKKFNDGIFFNGCFAKKSTIWSLLNHYYPSRVRAPFHPNPPTRFGNPNDRRYSRSRFLVQSSHGARCHITSVRSLVAGMGGYFRYPSRPPHLSTARTGLLGGIIDSRKC